MNSQLQIWRNTRKTLIADKFATKTFSILHFKSVLIHVIEQIEKSAVPTDGLLAGHGLSRAHLSDPYAMIPLSRYVPLFEDASRLSGLHDLGAWLGTMIIPRYLGPAGVLMSVSPTILDGINRLTRHVNAIQGATANGLPRVGEGDIWS